MKQSPSSILVIGDTHEPFAHKNYLEFCKQTQNKYGCGQVVHIGDLVDNHAISYHEHDPDGHSAGEEMERAVINIAKWTKAFPKVKLCKGNHDILPNRVALTHGFPRRIVRRFEEMWELPSTWEYNWFFYIFGVKFQHGTGFSGQTSHMKATLANRQSTVIGHCHSVGGCNYLVNDLNRIFGLSTGCGLDRMQYPFWYGRDFKEKPVLGCGVVLESGKVGHFIPMNV